MVFMAEEKIVTERRMTIRIPEILARRVDSVVVERKAAERKFSLNDWLVEAIRGYVDRGTEAVVVNRYQSQAQRNEPHPIQSGARPKMTATELAASIPGLRLGSSAAMAEPAEVEMGENVKTKPWLPELIRLQRMSEMDPASSADEFATLLHGEAFRPPKGWAMWSMEKRARWLDENKPIIVEGW